jgi:hypothetical protein
MKMCKDFSQILAIKELAVATQHSNSLPFTHTHPTCLTWSPATFLFLQLKIILNIHCFYTNEVIHTESKAVLNTLTEQDTSK